MADHYPLYRVPCSQAVIGKDITAKNTNVPVPDEYQAQQS